SAQQRRPTLIECCEGASLRRLAQRSSNPGRAECPPFTVLSAPAPSNGDAVHSAAFPDRSHTPYPLLHRENAPATVVWRGLSLASVVLQASASYRVPYGKRRFSGPRQAASHSSSLQSRLPAFRHCDSASVQVAATFGSLPGWLGNSY